MTGDARSGCCGGFPEGVINLSGIDDLIRNGTKVFNSSRTLSRLGFRVRCAVRSAALLRRALVSGFSFFYEEYIRRRQEMFHVEHFLTRNRRF